MIQTIPEKWGYSILFGLKGPKILHHYIQGMRGGSINGGGTPDLHGWGCNNCVKLYTNNAHTHSLKR